MIVTEKKPFQFNDKVTGHYQDLCQYETFQEFLTEHHGFETEEEFIEDYELDEEEIEGIKESFNYTYFAYRTMGWYEKDTVELKHNFTKIMVDKIGEDDFLIILY
jgi:hypothetical protein